jgi:hypothetical protein
MKTLTYAAAALVTLAVTGALAQPVPTLPVPVPSPAVPPSSTSLTVAAPRTAQSEEPSRFDLDFPGGTPKELVAAIQKALGRPLNAIVPDEFADIKLPALKMANVTAYQLFQALEQASRKSQTVQGGRFTTSYGFRLGSGPSISDDTIWSFHAEKPTIPPASPVAKVCRFYSLAPYLDRQLTVDDITTAIETGWKMLGEASPATIKFHKDTKLLIAVGEPGKLEIIDAALKALDVPRPAPAASSSTPMPLPAERTKSQE